jgi:hypothetical protein
MWKYVSIAFVLIIGALTILEVNAKVLEKLTPEEANRPWEEWTEEQILEKGWKPYYDDEMGEKGLCGTRWPKNDPGPPRRGICVTYSFMVNSVLMDSGAALNTWPGAMPTNSALQVAAAFWTWWEAADIHPSVEGDGGGPWNAPGPPGLVGDIRIGSHSFDGQWNILAHAYCPPPNRISAAGDLHFDHAEAWVIEGADPDSPFTNLDIQTVALHELGHSLGLTHSKTVPRDVMFPTYNAVKRELNTDSNGTDIPNIQLLYGPPGHSAECRAVGACLSAQGKCLGVMTQEECNSLGGVWQGEGTWCMKQIPTLSQWGLVILVVLIVFSTWVVLRRRKVMGIR